MVEIKYRDTGEVIASADADNLIKANLCDTDLRGADLSGADLAGANLSEANLRWANLAGANLFGANLIEANLTEADLAGADLHKANLCKADLRNANLVGANLRGAILTSALLSRANFRGSNLAEADLTEIRADFFAVLSLARNEIAGLRLAVVEGQIDGSSYNGPCACLVGTIAILQDCDYGNVPGIPIDAARPAERLFTGIGEGDTPETNPVSAIVLGWIDEFTAAVPATVQ